MSYSMQDYEEELGLKLFLINESTKRLRNIMELRAKRYTRALPFELDIKITADYLKAVRENNEAEAETRARINV